MKLVAPLNLNFLLKLFFLTLVLCFTDCFAKGDLTRQKPLEVEILFKGKVGESHFYDPSVLNFETGKLYKLKLINTSDSKHYFSSHGFTNSIFTRKIQIVKNKKKIAEIKGKINEVEVFPGNTIEIFFTCEQSICTYQLILYILKDYSEENKSLTKTKLKMELVLIYQNYEEIMNILFKILESQGKGSIIKLVKNGIITMEDLLLSEDYYLTNLDFALIAIHYNIPLIFLSSTLLVENNKSFMIVNSTNNEDFYFVRTPGVRSEGLPVQRLFDSNGGLIPLRNLKEKFKKEIEEKIGFNYINDYLKNFEKKAREKKIIIIPKKKNKDT